MWMPPKIKLAGTALAAGLLLAWPSLALAATHNVAVKSSAFITNNLVIQPGDTVVWTYAPLEPDCTYGCTPEVLHTVTADNQSFSSGPPSGRFTYEQTFTDLGEILYHCEVHSAPGRDINGSMNGRITVQEEPEAVFQINPGLNDSWYNPLTNGQGFLVMVFPDIEQMFVAWFTFDLERPPEGTPSGIGDPGHRWLIAQGPYSGNTANLTIFIAEGGVFDSPTPPATIDPAGDGTLTLEFADCTQAMVTYNITSVQRSGEIPVQRIVNDNVALCDALNEASQAAQ